MPDFLTTPCTAFQGDRRLASGSLVDVALAVKARLDSEPATTVLTFDDETGKIIDFDLRGSRTDIERRLAARAGADAGATAADDPARGRGRPKLGVVAREVTLLPRHWDWLASQSGGASATLRRLVEEARRRDAGKSSARAAQAAAYIFMSAMAGDREGFEEASRALFAGDRTGFEAQAATWPADIRDHVLRLMDGGRAPAA